MLAKFERDSGKLTIEFFRRWVTWTNLPNEKICNTWVKSWLELKKKKKKKIYIYLYAGIVNCQDKNNPEHSECWREEQVLIQAT